MYPEKMPDYDVIFAFLNEDERRPAVPHWALPVVLEEEELEDAGEQVMPENGEKTGSSYLENRQDQRR